MIAVWRWVIATVLLSLGGCVSRVENRVHVYCAVDREMAEPLLGAFERAISHDQKTEFQVETVFDVEATKSVGLANRLLKENPTQADVFWNGELLQTVRLARAGKLAELPFDLPERPADLSSPGKHWAVSTARGRVLLINHEVLPERDRWPTRVADLADATWQGRCAVASPLFGSTSTHMLALSLNPKAISVDDFWTWWSNVHDNAVVLSGNKQVAVAVGRGDLAWGLTDTDDALIEQENGRPVSIVFPDQLPTASGMMLIPGSVAILRGARHPVAAATLAEFLLSSKAIDRIRMANAAQFAFDGDHVLSDHLETDQLRWMTVDYDQAADAWPAFIERMSQVSQQSSKRLGRGESER